MYILCCFLVIFFLLYKASRTNPSANTKRDIPPTTLLSGQSVVDVQKTTIEPDKPQVSPLSFTITSPSSYDYGRNYTSNDTESTSVFKDNRFEFTDYSHLSPSQARREMKERKEYGEWLEFDEYGGYMNAIGAERDYDFIEKIEAMTPDEVSKWFRNRKLSGYWTTTPVYEAIAEKLKPAHEAYLLVELDKVTIGRVESWVGVRKSEGYFFSELAYAKAAKILSGEIENRKTKQPKKMKNIAVLALLIAPLLGFGQTADSLDMPVLDGKVGFQKVVTIDSVTSKEILQRAKLYFTEKYESGKDVIQLVDEGVIIGKGITHVNYIIMITPVQIEMKYMVRIEVKDNRYRYTIDRITTKTNDVHDTWGPIEAYWRYPNLGKKARKLLGGEIRATASQLEAYIQKPSVSKSDKW